MKQKTHDFLDSSAAEDESAFIRPNILKALASIAKNLKATMTTEIGTNPDGQKIVALHPHAVLLNKLIDAIKDLDSGVIHPVLQSTGNGGNTKSTEERKAYASLVELVEVVQQEYFPKNRSKAEFEVAKRLRERSVTIKGEPATREGINSIIRHRPKAQGETAKQDQPVKRGRPKNPINQ